MCQDQRFCQQQERGGSGEEDPPEQEELPRSQLLPRGICRNEGGLGEEERQKMIQPNISFDCKIYVFNKSGA